MSLPSLHSGSSSGKNSNKGISKTAVSQLSSRKAQKSNSVQKELISDREFLTRQASNNGSKKQDPA